MKKLVFYRISRLMLELTIASGIGFLLINLTPDIPYRIINGIVAGLIILRLCRIFDLSTKPDPLIRKYGMILVGLSIGFSISWPTLLYNSMHLPLYICLAIGAILLGCLIGYLYSRLTSIDIYTGLLSTMPGGLGVMTAVAAETGHNVAIVSAIQTLRMILVILFVALFSGHFANNQVKSNFEHFTFNYYEIIDMLMLLSTSWIAANIAQRLHIPIASFFAALVVGLIFQGIINPLITSFSPPILLPKSLVILGQVMLGISVGEAISVRLKLPVREAIYGTLSVISTIFIGLLGACIVHAVIGCDWLTSILMTAPGGAAEIMVFALVLPVNVELVTLSQLTRQLIINLFLPMWINFFAWLERKLAFQNIA